MSWEELIQRLQEIPENRRHESAVFLESSEQGSDGYTIDDVDLVNCIDYTLDCTVGNDTGDSDKDTTYVLTP